MLPIRPLGISFSYNMQRDKSPKRKTEPFAKSDPATLPKTSSDLLKLIAEWDGVLDKEKFDFVGPSSKLDVRLLTTTGLVNRITLNGEWMLIAPLFMKPSSIEPPPNKRPDLQIYPDGRLSIHSLLEVLFHSRYNFTALPTVSRQGEKWTMRIVHPRFGLLYVITDFEEDLGFQMPECNLYNSTADLRQELAEQMQICCIGVHLRCCCGDYPSFDDYLSTRKHLDCENRSKPARSLPEQ